MGEIQRRVDEVRSDRTELENHLIDEYSAGRISRREFVRRGTVIGLSIPLVTWLAAACGGGEEAGGEAAPTTAADTGGGAATTEAPATTGAAGQPGGTIRIGIQVPSGQLDPVTVADTGGLCCNGQTGEYLSLSLGEPELTPVIAESWEPNADATVWTFKIRQGVTFNDEAATPMTAKDVAATFNRLADPENGSNALSVFKGILSGGAVSAPDDTTVVFELEAPSGSWPWLVSSDNYNAIILPESYAGNWDETWVGTGPWKLESYQPTVGAALVRNENYWGEKALPDRNEMTFYPADQQAKILALQAKGIDALDVFSVAVGQSLLANEQDFNVINLKASTHRELSMRCDQEPFTDKRVRQAIALTLDRPAIIEGLFKGFSDLGNDNPFAPVFSSTDTTVPQRTKDIEQAKQLLADAGMANGFQVQLNAISTAEVPDFAQLVQSSAKEIGIDIKLVVQDPATYYGDAVFGASPWLDSIMSLVDYGHRGVPNVFLGAPLLSDGVWNAAHFKNETYDKLVGDFFAEADIERQRNLAGQIETLLLDETPIIYAYFYNYLSASLKNVTGVVPTAIGHLFVDQATVA